MAKTLTIVDESVSGERLNSFTLDSLTETVTIRELIRARIYQEVQDYNQRRTGLFTGLVQPDGAEKLLNGFKLKRTRPIDWEQQFEKACEAFESNGFFILVGDQQAEALDQAFEIKVDTEVSFVKLVPLVGG